MKRIFLIVLDSCGIGQMPDAAAFGDENVNTLRSCAASEHLHIPNLIASGIGNIDGVTYPLVKLEITSSSHPFFTGKQKLVDTAGRVDKFLSRYGNRKKN